LDDRFSIEKNHWEIQNPEWESYSHFICTKDHYWTGVHGISNYFLQYKNFGRSKPVERFSVEWPNFVEHMWFIHWRGPWDYIFASYKLSEIKRFLELDIDTIKKNHWPDGRCTCYSIYDYVKKKWYYFKIENLGTFYGCKWPLGDDTGEVISCD
jgi:hypothetical protein